MNDGINRIPPTRPPGYGVRSAGSIDRDKLEQNSVVEDRIDIHADPQAKPEEQKEDISLSVGTIRIIAQGNLDPDIENALTAFAPLGDLKDADHFCDLLEARGVEFIAWPPELSLAQALEKAAS